MWISSIVTIVMQRWIVLQPLEECVDVIVCNASGPNTWLRPTLSYLDASTWLTLTWSYIDVDVEEFIRKTIFHLIHTI